MPPRRTRPSATENDPPQPSSASALAPPRLTRSKTAGPPLHPKSLRPSSAAASSIGAIEEEQEEDEEDQKRSSDHREEDESEPDAASGGSRNGRQDSDGSSALAGTDDSRSDSGSEDGQENGSFFQQSLDTLPNRLFLSEKAALDDGEAAFEGTEVTTGWFVVDKQLGTGAFGIVFGARHEVDSNTVYAVKVIQAPTEALQQKVKRELDAQFDCRRDFVLPILGATMLNAPRGFACIVMPVAAGSLADLLKHRDTLVPSRQNKAVLDHLHSLSSNWFSEICDAVAHIHDKGYAHRDLKPENILFVVNAGVLVPQVGDFGCAQFVEKGVKYGFAGTLPRSGSEHLFEALSDTVLRIGSSYRTVEILDRLAFYKKANTSSPFGEDCFALFMLALDFFYEGPPLHLVRIARLRSRLENGTLSMDDFADEIGTHFDAYSSCIEALLTADPDRQRIAADEALPGAPSWIHSFLIFSIMNGYRCEDLASFSGSKSIVKRLRMFIPVPSAQPRPAHDAPSLLDRSFPSDWVDALRSTSPHRAPQSHRRAGRSRQSLSEDDDANLSNDSASSNANRAPSDLAEGVSESLRKALGAKWPRLTHAEHEEWRERVDANPQRASKYDGEKASLVGKLSRPSRDSSRPELWSCEVAKCDDRLGHGKRGAARAGRTIKKAVMHARSVHGRKGGSFVRP